MHRGVALALIAFGCGGSAPAVKKDTPQNCEAQRCVTLGDQAHATKDMVTALAYYRRACELNVALGCGDAAMMLLQGEAGPVNEREGYDLMVKGCTLGDSRACNNAGAAWSEGISGAERIDHVQARTFYEKACALNNGLGCFNLGNVFRLGEDTQVDLKSAFEHFKRACELDEAKGCTELAILYFDGKAIRRDIEKAIELFGKACRLGSKPACKNIDVIRNVTP
jgi:uncharacterized protein